MSAETGDLVGKDPNASQWPKGIDWTDQLAEWSPTESIASSTWAITGKDSALTYADDSIVVGGRATQVRLSGGTLGRKYTVTNSIETNTGIKEDRSFKVLIEQK